MIIKADNRGRIALSKLGIGKAHQDWEVKPLGDGRTITLKSRDGENGSEWGYHIFLTPEMIGQVIRIQGVYHGWDVVNEKMPLPRVKNYQPEIVGVLEAYSLVEGREWVKIQGSPGLIDLGSKSNLGNEYGETIYFGVRA